MSYFQSKNFYFEVAKGTIPKHSSVNKFGSAPSGLQTTATDLWSRADSGATQQIWLAPTAPRIHNIVSTDANDDGNPVGTGARTLRIYGLKTWDTAETSEIIMLNGTTPVPTVDSYVIIHRMKVLTSGATSINIGTITATAAAPDSTITAVIPIGQGQTQMAIYGVPSTHDAYMTRWSANIDKTAGAAASADFELRVNENPNVQTTNYIRKQDISLQSTGTNMYQSHFELPIRFAGPCIIKVQAIASTNDIDGESAFDLILVEK